MTVDLLSAVAGAGLFAAGLSVRALIGRRGPRTPQTVTTPVCGCTHDLALHDRQTGECHGEIRKEHYYASGDRNGWKWVRCACRRYVGPEHIADVWAPGVLPPAS